MKKIIPLFVLIFLALNCRAQLSVVWDKMFGISIRDINATHDNNLILTGTVASEDSAGFGCSTHGAVDVFVLKMDLDGNVLWKKCYGGSLSEHSYRIRETIDHGFIIGAYTESNDGDVSGNHGTSDFWIFKVDSIGELQWQHCYGGSGTDLAFCDVIELSDGNFMLTGVASYANGDIPDHYGAVGYYDAWVVKTDSVGEIIWSRIYGGTISELFRCIKEISPNKIELYGYSTSTDIDLWGLNNVDDAWIVTIDSIGDIISQDLFGGESGDGYTSVLILSNKEKIVVGGTSSTTGAFIGGHGLPGDAWVVKMDSLNNVQWMNIFGGSYSDGFYTVHPAPFNSGYYLGGYSNSSDGDVIDHHGTNGGVDFWIVKIDTGGSKIWAKSLGGTLDEQFYSLELLTNLFLVGRSESTDGDVTSNVTGNGGGWIVKLSDYNSIAENILENVRIKFYPNPLHDVATLELTNEVWKKVRALQLYSVQGQLLEEIKIQSIKQEISFNYSAGIYFYKLLDKNNRLLSGGDLIIQ